MRPRRTLRMLASLLVAAALHACLVLDTPATGTGYRGPPLLQLQGQMTADRGFTASGAIGLAVVWFPAFRHSPAGRSVVIPGDTRYELVFPASYTFNLYDLPPPEARFVLTDEGGGQGALGLLLAYEDRNGNGTLDSYAPGQRPVDRVLGLGETTIVYRDGYLGPDAPADLKQGLNLLGDGEVIAPGTPIPIHLSSATHLDFLVCEGAMNTDGGASLIPLCLELDAGQPDAGVSLRIGGSVGIYGDGHQRTGSAAYLFVEVGGMTVTDASVTLNGTPIPWDNTQFNFRWEASDGGFLIPGEPNALSVTIRNNPPQTVDFLIPGDFMVAEPADRSELKTKTETLVTWSAAFGAQTYRVTLRSATMATLYDNMTQTTSVMIPPLDYVGTANLTISAEAEGSTEVPYSSVHLYNNRTRFLTFAP